MPCCSPFPSKPTDHQTRSIPNTACQNSAKNVKTCNVIPEVSEGAGPQTAEIELPATVRQKSCSNKGLKSYQV